MNNKSRLKVIFDEDNNNNDFYLINDIIMTIFHFGGIFECPLGGLRSAYKCTGGQEKYHWPIDVSVITNEWE